MFWGHSCVVGQVLRGSSETYKANQYLIQKQFEIFSDELKAKDVGIVRAEFDSDVSTLNFSK